MKEIPAKRREKRERKRGKAVELLSPIAVIILAALWLGKDYLIRS